VLAVHSLVRVSKSRKVVLERLYMELGGNAWPLFLCYETLEGVARDRSPYLLPARLTKLTERLDLDQESYVVKVTDV
jgi:hypothetical protein